MSSINDTEIILLPIRDPMSDNFLPAEVSSGFKAIFKSLAASGWSIDITSCEDSAGTITVADKHYLIVLEISANTRDTWNVREALELALRAAAEIENGDLKVEDYGQG